MSKTYKATLPCPNCKNYFEATLYRSIWGEYPENREIVFNDTINSPICPHCNNKAKIGNATLMYHNAQRHFAVWYEPQYDKGIDNDNEGYAKMFGRNSYLAQAPRIKDWEDFKNTIVKYETGILKGDPGETSPELKQQFEGFMKSISSQPKKSKNSGCLLVVLLVIAFSTLLMIS